MFFLRMEGSAKRAVSSLCETIVFQDVVERMSCEQLRKLKTKIEIILDKRAETMAAVIAKRFKEYIVHEACGNERILKHLACFNYVICIGSVRFSDNDGMYININYDNTFSVMHVSFAGTHKRYDVRISDDGLHYFHLVNQHEIMKVNSQAHITLVSWMWENRTKFTKTFYEIYEEEKQMHH